ncbi:hypothetical protein A5731_21830 [Mycolicibacterium conceptionense]|uniref:Transmembrane protein n=1 Tax=Mycolicibacterium conceptionense TaxID=451644 RepID=A0A1A0PI12_9MYCO|nr:hypothetical protein A5718_10855 [Mycolicibacterium conceptionense]OBE98357.1 hypothetical protein A5731_21830 [Mycolicibacterium conceptionense]OBF24080.1 hypothetical protein A5726_10250 [Mycolicibacterium conceptionense]OBF47138.1 hypothetical protein A5720_06290 [Mycolicibacterium conceptionense]OBH96888.1 hypothetical protein A5716_17050 [Mycolicibacterium conceptionense]
MLTVLSGAAEAFSINKVSGADPEWWWWLVVAVALVGALVGAVWGLRMRDGDAATTTSSTGNRAGDTMGSVVVSQQNTGDKGRNISISADNGSFAAYRVDEIKDLTIGEHRKKEPGGPPA